MEIEDQRLALMPVVARWHKQSVGSLPLPDISCWDDTPVACSKLQGEEEGAATRLCPYAVVPNMRSNAMTMTIENPRVIVGQLAK
jgi:hypothetical protein